MLTTISAADLRADPSARLWALLEHLLESPESLDDPGLRALRLAYIYDSEIQNGGHLQYFYNRGLSDAPEAVLALKQIGAAAQAAVLEEALLLVASSPILAVETFEEYSVRAMRREFSTQDSRYYLLQPEVIDLLESFIAPRLPNLIGVDCDA